MSLIKMLEQHPLLLTGICPPELKSLKTTKVTFTCSRSTIETLEKGVKYVQS